jgi:hypothetical protein
MMKLKSLKQSFKDWNEPVVSEKDEFYPSLYLDEKNLDKLGIDNLRAGTEMVMVAKVRVSSVSDNANGNRSMSFEFLEAAMSRTDRQIDASKLFPNG